MKPLNIPARALAPVLAVPLGLALSITMLGCGGGGGGGSSPNAQTTINGLVQDANKDALAGYTVTYDKNTVTDASAALTAVTDAGGHYALTVPSKDVTGQDALSFYDALGGLVAVQAVSVDTGQPSMSLTSTITVGPPGVAPAVRK